MLNGGYGTIKIGIGIYGIKSKLCLKLSNSDIHSITGEFRNNTIEVGNFIFKLNMHSNKGLEGKENARFLILPKKDLIDLQL